LEGLVPASLSFFKKRKEKGTYNARTCWYCQQFRLIYRYQVKAKYKKAMDRDNSHKLQQCIMANIGAIWQRAAQTTYHLLLAAQHEQYNNDNNKSPSLNLM